MRRACVIVGALLTVAGQGVKAALFEAGGRQPPARASVSGDVSLVGAGNAPRTKIRYAPAIGAAQSVTLVISIDAGQEVQGRSQAIHTPEMTLKLRVVVDDALDAGGLRYHAEITGAEARARPGSEPRLLDPFRDYCATLAGTSLKFSATPRGQLHDLAAKLPHSESQEIGLIAEHMPGILSELVCRVPAEEVGAGARWNVTTLFGGEGSTTSRQHELELFRIQKGVYVVRDAALAKPESLPPGGDNPEQSLTLKDASFTSRMSYQIHPPNLMPVQAEGKVTQVTDAVRGGPEGKSERVKQRITMNLSCKSKEDDRSK
jgi:hypothetical protein